MIKRITQNQSRVRDDFKSQFLKPKKGRGLTYIKNYEKFCLIKTFLNSKFIEHSMDNQRSLRDTDVLKNIMGLKNKHKLLGRMKDDWLGLKRPIPITFLEMLGVTVRDFNYLLELEKKAFNKALLQAVQPQCFTYWFLPGLYSNIRLPKGINEEQAIGYIQKFLRDKGFTKPGFHALISYHGIKRVRISLDSSQTTIFPPQILIRKTHVEFFSLPLGYGTKLNG